LSEIKLRLLQRFLEDVHNVGMSEQKLYENLMSLNKGVEACLDNKLIGPALILIYSAIDTAGWLGCNDQFATRDSFIDWTNRYLLSTNTLSCTAVDLYAARCGLLHTFTPNSKLSRDKKARRICYAWGKSRAEDLQRTIDLAKTGTDYVAVQIEDLFAAWGNGALAFTDELDSDVGRNATVMAKAKNFFSALGSEFITELLDAVDQQAMSKDEK
jgi:hypothetical protein